jgi:preprotein translocase subunit SecD
MKKETAKKAGMDKSQKRNLIWFIVILLAGLAFMAGIFSYFNYFALDNQFEADTYTFALEKNGELYKLEKFQESSFAFDEQLHTTSPHYLAELAALSYDDHEITKTDNPFFAGNISSKNLKKYLDQQTKYTNPKESYQSYTFYDQNRNQIFAYEPETQSEYTVKIRPNYPSSDPKRNRFFDKREYLNLTKLLKDKLDKNLKIKTDEENKLLILSFEN